MDDDYDDDWSPTFVGDIVTWTGDEEDRHWHGIILDVNPHVVSVYWLVRPAKSSSKKVTQHSNREFSTGAIKKIA